jgi:hypothetical protein
MTSRMSTSMRAMSTCGAFLFSVANVAAQSAEPQKAAPNQPPKFAPPVRLLVGGQPMGAERLYPSPVLRDMTGDGRVDVVLGDLWGAITIAPRLVQDGAPAWGPDIALKSRDGKDLKFSNW